LSAEKGNTSGVDGDFVSVEARADGGGVHTVKDLIIGNLQKAPTALNLGVGVSMTAI